MFFRLQSFYLFIALVCLSANLNLIPFWEYNFYSSDGVQHSEPMILYGLNIFGRTGEVSVVFYVFNIALCGSVLITLVSLMLFKNRKYQSLSSYIGSLLSFITLSSALLASFALKSKLGTDTVEGSAMLGFYLLVLPPFLFFLAARAILSDEMQATAYQRL